MKRLTHLRPQRDFSPVSCGSLVTIGLTTVDNGKYYSKNIACRGKQMQHLRTAMELRGIPCHEERDYAAVDALNARYGKGKVFSAAQGLGARSWHMKRQKLSRRPTTRWDELMTVR